MYHDGGMTKPTSIRIDERLRMADHPGILFKNGPTGRRAALAHGPDVWEIIKFFREIDERGPAALGAAAEMLAVDADRITAAVDYYREYREEIDAEIDAADDASERAWSSHLAGGDRNRVEARETLAGLLGFGDENPDSVPTGGGAARSPRLGLTAVRRGPGPGRNRPLARG
jgi:hypothetical protein